MSYDSYLPLLVPGVVAALVVSIAACGQVARWLGARRAVAWLLILSTGVVLAVTVTPHIVRNGPSHPPARFCDFSRIGPAGIAELTRPSEALGNILLFIPLGFAIALVPRSPHRAALIAAAFALPFVIEATQLVLVPLGRGCQAADVTDNLMGLALGLAAGALIAALVPAVHPDGREHRLDRAEAG